ncbi:MAG: cobalamin-binding protein [Myxococcota bacterium]
MTTAPAPSPRVVSLLPSATEIVCAVGGATLLVGRSHECDHPAAIADRPVLTAPAGPMTGDSRTIHERVEAHLAAALSVYEVDAPRLRSLGPSVIVTQDLCEVCAVARPDVEAAVAGAAGNDRPTIVSLDPKTLGDIFADVRRVGEALGMAARADQVATELAARAEGVNERPGASGPSVLAIEWIDPVMIGGLWMHEVIARAGGRPLGPPPGAYAETVDRAALAQLDPDVVLIKPCGMSTARAREEVATLARTLPWTEWRAAARGAVFIVDGNAYFNRPGPRIVASIEVAAACIAAATGRASRWSDRHGHDIWRVASDLSSRPLRDPPRG